MSRVLVLNGDYRPINVTTIRRAVVLLIMEKAEVVERNDGYLHAETLILERPAVIRLVTYVRLPHPVRRRVTRRAVLARDGHRCMYCGDRSNLTIDHVVPRSKGGETSWTNVVAARQPCNGRKQDSLPQTVGMALRQIPRAPKPDVFVYVAVKVPPVTWRSYLM